MLTEKGFRRPTLEELIAARVARAKQLFGDDVDTSEPSVLGKFLRIGAYDIAQAYETLEKVYYARFPNSAGGQSLDRLLPFAGIQRDPPRAAVHLVEMRGTSGHVVPIGFLVGGGGVTFHTLEDVVLINGKGEVRVECNEPGTAGNVAEISALINPDADVFGVQYRALLIPGSGSESDYELRRRFQKTVAGAGSATADAITAEIMRVQGVQGCLLEENDSSVTDKAGRPPHSFECFVLAPESADFSVAHAIFRKKPLGIKSVGSVAVEVQDNGGLPHTVHFSRTHVLPIFLRTVIRTNVLFEGGGTAEIVQNLYSHVAGLKNGEEVVRSTLYGAIHKTPGVVETVLLELSSDGINYAPRNIPVGADAVARLLPQNIKIEVEDNASQ